MGRQRSERQEGPSGTEGELGRAQEDLRRDVVTLQRPCGENRAALEETQGLLEKARTEQCEQARKVGSLLDDQRAAAGAQAETGLVELRRLLAKMQLQQGRFGLEVSALREDLAAKPDAEGIE